MYIDIFIYMYKSILGLVALYVYIHRVTTNGTAKENFWPYIESFRIPRFHLQKYYYKTSL